MKYSTALTAAALVGSALGGRDGAFAVMRFNGKEICKGRMDPIVTYGEPSAHVHSVFGGSKFGLHADGKKLQQSKCTSAKVKGDKSAYWSPTVFYHDEEAGTFEPVPVMYTNVYYFFEATDDDMKPFPLGLSMVSGDAMTRVLPPGGGQQCLDPNNGPINAALWTCPRLDYENPLSWPADSDGSSAGVGDKVNKGQGAGFPSHTCDQTYSPLRADIHFPSCYKTSAGLTDYQNNMAWPTSKGASQPGRVNCPDGYIHVPHIFMEIYWDTAQYADRWNKNSGPQPFVLSNGDVTGFSIHADFMSGWDEDLLQGIIDNCNTGHAGVHECPGIAGTDQVNDEECTCEDGDLYTDDDLSGPMSKLPGNNPLAGWKYGTANMPPPATSPSKPPTYDQPKGDDKPKDNKPDDTMYKDQKPKDDKPDDKKDDTSDDEKYGMPDDKKDDKPTNGSEKADESSDRSSPDKPNDYAAGPAPTNPPLSEPNKGGACKVETVWETTTVTIDAAAPTVAPATAANSTDSSSKGGFKLAGCFQDKKDSRVLSGDQPSDLGPMTNEKCVTHCKGKGFALAGTQYAGQCFCGNELVGSNKLEDAKCDMACEGDSADLCGGSEVLSVYSVDGEASVKTGSSRKARRHIHAHHARAHRHLSY